MTTPGTARAAALTAGVVDVTTLVPDRYGVTRVRTGRSSWVDVLPATFGRGRVVTVPHSCPMTYDQAWCYDSYLGALLAAAAWDPDADPEPTGWVKHVNTGRRRPDGDPSREHVAP